MAEIGDAPDSGTTSQGLSRADGALVRLSAVLAARDPARLRAALEACGSRVRPGEVEEVILQSYLFLGYPTALDAFRSWRRVSGRKAGEAAEEDWEGWIRRGERVCRRVYAGQYEGLRDNIRALHPDMERWMVVEGYGKVLGRPGLELERRELCIAALLAVLGASTQLYSHLRGALNAGAPREAVEEAVELACREADQEAAREARKVWERVRSR